MKCQSILRLIAFSAVMVYGLPVEEVDVPVEFEPEGYVTPLQRRDPETPQPLPVKGVCPYSKVTKTGTSTYLSQVSDTNTCGDVSCTVGMQTSHTFSVDKSVDFTLTAGAATLDLGVSFGEAWTTGKTNGCTGTPGQTICQWVNVPYVNVQLSNPISDNDRFPKTCTNTGTAEARYPLTDGQKYYCVSGATNCRTDRQGYWA